MGSVHRQYQAGTWTPHTAARPVSGRGGPGKTGVAPRPLRRTFGGTVTQVPIARGFLRRHLAMWTCPAATIEDVLQCASELAANAVLHSRSGRPDGYFTVDVAIQPAQWVRVAVEDSGGPWAEHSTLADPEGGRGLQIVAALSADMGITGDSTGRTAWFRCPWNPEEAC